MDLKTYSKLMASLISDQGSLHDNMLHMTAGIVGETGEVTDIFKKVWIQKKEIDKGHLLEELGDVLFYVVGLTRITLNRVSYLRFDPQYPMRNSQKERVAHCITMSKKVGRLSELVDGFWWSSHPFDYDELIYLLNAIVSDITTLAITFDISPEDILEANYRKLSVRYPGLVFDSEKANNRDVEAEKEAIRQ